MKKNLISKRLQTISASSTLEISDKIKDISQNSQGLIVVTGPTGSGKTTTLYSALSTQQIKQLKKNQNLLSGTEVRIIEEIENLKTN